MQSRSSPQKSAKSDRHVASRYKQAALKKSASKRNTPNHLLVTQSTRSDTSSEYLITPSRNQRNELTSSTPAFNTTSIPVCDASSIAVDQSFMPALKDPLVATGVKKKTYKSNVRRKADNVTLPVFAFPEQQKRKEKAADQVTEEDLDILYAQYLQAVFLESRAEKTLEMKAEDGLESLHKLWAMNQKIMQENSFYKQELCIIRFVKHTMKYCKLQKDMYKSADDAVSTVIPYFEEIAKAVDCLRNKLYAPHVSFSTDANFQEELVIRIKAYEELLQSFSNVFTPDDTELPVVAELLEKISGFIDETNMEIEKCKDYLSAVDYLTVNESSLKIAQVQLKNVS